MGCGMGGCYSCVIPVRDAGGGHHYVRSCLAGPVFDGAESCGTNRLVVDVVGDSWFGVAVVAEMAVD